MRKNAYKKIRCTREVGNPMNRKSANPIGFALGKNQEAVCDRMRLGGVPVITAIPPIEEVNATERSIAFANGSIISASQVISSSFSTIAMTFGTMVRAVAVLEMKRPSKNVTKVMPRSKTLGFNPKMMTVLRAILEWRFHLTIAMLKMNPPMKMREVSVKRELAISDADETLNKGIRNIGKKAVITMGIGSKIQ